MYHATISHSWTSYIDIQYVRTLSDRNPTQDPRLSRFAGPCHYSGHISSERARVKFTVSLQNSLSPTIVIIIVTDQLSLAFCIDCFCFPHHSYLPPIVIHLATTQLYLTIGCPLLRHTLTIIYCIYESSDLRLL